MARDLAMTTDEVHEGARAVLRFWLQETPAELRFAKDAALDATIRARFGAMRDRVVAAQAAGWGEDPVTTLGAIILIDQFSRNLYRDDPRAFEGDRLARRLTRTALRAGWDTGMTGDERVFLYMPLMHSEDAGDQADSVALFTQLGRKDNLNFAIAHRDVIAQYGRFPSRNAALGRASTADEEAYLSRPDAGW